MYETKIYLFFHFLYIYRNYAVQCCRPKTKFIFLATKGEINFFCSMLGFGELVCCFFVNTPSLPTLESAISTTAVLAGSSEIGRNTLGENILG